MVDLVLRGDSVVTPHGVGAFDLAIEDGRIVAIAARRHDDDPRGRQTDRRHR